MDLDRYIEHQSQVVNNDPGRKKKKLKIIIIISIIAVLMVAGIIAGFIMLNKDGQEPAEQPADIKSDRVVQDNSTDAGNYTSQQPEQTDEPPADMCGDGICGLDEEGSCPEDCQKKTEPAEICGNHVCEPQEIINNNCPDDCETKKEDESKPVQPASECGNGICETSEIINNNCDLDCSR